MERNELNNSRKAAVSTILPPTPPTPPPSCYQDVAYEHARLRSHVYTGPVPGRVDPALTVRVSEFAGLPRAEMYLQ